MGGNCPGGIDLVGIVQGRLSRREFDGWELSGGGELSRGELPGYLLKYAKNITKLENLINKINLSLP